MPSCKKAWLYRSGDVRAPRCVSLRVFEYVVKKKRKKFKNAHTNVYLHVYKILFFFSVLLKWSHRSLFLCFFCSLFPPPPLLMVNRSGNGQSTFFCCASHYVWADSSSLLIQSSRKRLIVWLIFQEKPRLNSFQKHCQLTANASLSLHFADDRDFQCGCFCTEWENDKTAEECPFRSDDCE